MFGMGGFEMLIVGIVALIVIGPKDLPVVFRKVGRFVGQARGMAREFSSAMNQAADDSGMKDLQKTIRTATNPVGSAFDGVKDAARDMSSSLTNLDPDSETGKLAAEKSERTAERMETARKIQAQTARANAERMQREAEEALQKAEALEAHSAPKAEKEG